MNPNEAAEMLGFEPQGPPSDTQEETEEEDEWGTPIHPGQVTCKPPKYESEDEDPPPNSNSLAASSPDSAHSPKVEKMRVVESAEPHLLSLPCSQRLEERQEAMEDERWVEQVSRQSPDRAPAQQSYAANGYVQAQGEGVPHNPTGPKSSKKHQICPRFPDSELFFHEGAQKSPYPMPDPGVEGLIPPRDWRENIRKNEWKHSMHVTNFGIPFKCSNCNRGCFDTYESGSNLYVFCSPVCLMLFFPEWEQGAEEEDPYPREREVRIRMIRGRITWANQEDAPNSASSGEVVQWEVPPPPYQEDEEEEGGEYLGGAQDMRLLLTSGGSNELIQGPTRAPTPLEELCMETRTLAEATRSALTPAVGMLNTRVETLTERTNVLEQLSGTVDRMIPAIEGQIGVTQQGLQVLGQNTQEAFVHRDQQIQVLHTEIKQAHQHMHHTIPGLEIRQVEMHGHLQILQEKFHEMEGKILGMCAGQNSFEECQALRERYFEERMEGLDKKMDAILQQVSALWDRNKEAATAHFAALQATQNNEGTLRNLGKQVEEMAKVIMQVQEERKVTQDKLTQVENQVAEHWLMESREAGQEKRDINERLAGISQALAGRVDEIESQVQGFSTGRFEKAPWPHP